MDKLIVKLMELEQERESVERCQKSLREKMATLIKDEKGYLKEEMIYNKNKEELKEVNKKIDILNSALDIIEGIGV